MQSRDCASFWALPAGKKSHLVVAPFLFPDSASLGFAVATVRHVTPSATSSARTSYFSGRNLIRWCHRATTERTSVGSRRSTTSHGDGKLSPIWSATYGEFRSPSTARSPLPPYPLATGRRSALLRQRTSSFGRFFGPSVDTAEAQTSSSPSTTGLVRSVGEKWASAVVLMRSHRAAVRAGSSEPHRIRSATGSVRQSAPDAAWWRSTAPQLAHVPTVRSRSHPSSSAAAAAAAESGMASGLPSSS